MEWLRWIVLGVGIAVLVSIAWAYIRHRSEQAVELGSGRTEANADDPIDAQIRHQDLDEPLASLRVAPPSLGAIDTPKTPRNDDLRAEPHLAPRHEPHQELGLKPAVEPFAVEAEPLRWQQPTFTRARVDDLFARPDDDTPNALHSDADGVIGAVRRTVLDSSLDAPFDTGAPQQGGLFRQRQTARFGYQAKQNPTSADGAAEGTPPFDDEPIADHSAKPAKPVKSEQPIVIPLFVASRSGEAFPGDRVEDLIEEMGFDYGALSIFHYLDELGEPLFSLMNGVHPGTFDRGNSASFATPVLALFMQLPPSGHSQSELLTFDRMLDSARDIADHLEGDVLDDTRELLSSESIDRYREQLGA